MVCASLFAHCILRFWGLRIQIGLECVACWEAYERVNSSEGYVSFLLCDFGLPPLKGDSLIGSPPEKQFTFSWGMYVG